MEKCKYIECGKIINTHGVFGAVKIESWCNSAKNLADLKRIFISENRVLKEYRVKKASVFNQVVISELEGVTKFDEALALKNRIIYADRDDFDLKEGDFFVIDLIGQPVIDVNNGTVYGHISDVINRGASDIYVIQSPDGEKMIPAVEEFVKKIDIDTGVFVAPIEGMFD